MGAETKREAREGGIFRVAIAVASACLYANAFALTIESKDLGYVPGNTYNYAQGGYTVSGLDVSPGTGKTWDFSAFAGSGTLNYTKIYSVSNVSAFPTATLAIDISGKTSASFSFTSYFREQNGDWQSLGSITGSTVGAYSPYLPMGLPHAMGKSWSSTYAYAGASQTQSGTGIAEGTVITKLGSFPAVLSKVTNGSATSYWFETKEYGRIAYTVSPGDQLYLVVSGTRGLGVKPPGSPLGNTLFCEGGSGSISIRSRVPGRIRIYSAGGALFDAAEIRPAAPWIVPAASGSYFVRFESSRYDFSRNLIVGK